MGKTRKRHLILLIVLFLLTGVSVQLQTERAVERKSVRLQKQLEKVPGYRHSETFYLDQGIVSVLDLDDHISAEYEKDGRRVALYVGYYLSSNKVSAAHSPLACIPAQGWTLTAPAGQLLQVGNNRVKYNSTVATRDQRRELVLYWYQAHDKTETETYKNKINTLFNLIRSEKQDHAFVRVTIPIGESGLEEARVAGREFISAFYPVFLSYVTSR